MIYLAIYVLGVVIGLAVMRDDWPARLATALVWPLGPAAFLVVVPVMILAAAIMFPIPVLGGAAVLAAVVYALGC